MNQMTINTMILNILIATLGFLLVFYFNETKSDLKKMQIQLLEVQIQLREIQTKEAQYVTELRVIELIKEYAHELQNSK